MGVGHEGDLSEALGQRPPLEGEVRRVFLLTIEARVNDGLVYLKTAGNIKNTCVESR